MPKGDQRWKTKARTWRKKKLCNFTHQCESLIRLDLRYIPAGSRVLIVDDFLANGKAVNGLMSIIRKAGAQLIGVGIAIEKGFQPVTGFCGSKAFLCCLWR